MGSLPFLPVRNFRDPDAGATSLAARQQAQLDAINQFRVFYQFHFTDRLKESGITFVNHVVDDSGKNYMAVHFGIAVAE